MSAYYLEHYCCRFFSDLKTVQNKETVTCAPLPSPQTRVTAYIKHTGAKMPTEPFSLTLLYNWVCWLMWCKGFYLG